MRTQLLILGITLILGRPTNKPYHEICALNSNPKCEHLRLGLSFLNHLFGLKMYATRK